ncbi:hypothetical protein SSX86_004965 [Deinandra increscens subsp. villosa]|uniref:Uncharacterized protein n=1 Tax=Deinandra increscens subsp. villosa TaxID=3103831 RepID=A0AAP0DK71_9ASTR
MRFNFDIPEPSSKEALTPPSQPRSPPSSTTPANDEIEWLPLQNHVMRADVELDFIVDRITINRHGSALLLEGSNGLCVMYLYGRSSSKDSAVICSINAIEPQGTTCFFLHPYEFKVVGSCCPTKNSDAARGISSQITRVTLKWVVLNSLWRKGAKEASRNYALKRKVTKEASENYAVKKKQVYTDLTVDYLKMFLINVPTAVGVVGLLSTCNLDLTIDYLTVKVAMDGVHNEQAVVRRLLQIAVPATTYVLFKKPFQFYFIILANPCGLKRKNDVGQPGYS